MHNWAKSIMECVKGKIDAIGMDNVGIEHLEELKAWTCIAKDIAEYDYYYHITEAMEKPENEYGVNYDERGRYYTPPRADNGQFRQDMRRHGYVESYDVNPNYRNMDMRNGHMYYSYEDAVPIGADGSMMSTNTVRGYSDSGYERARRGYQESKMMDPDTENMDKLKDVFEELKTEMKELKPHMSQSAKSYARNELNNMANNMI